MTYGQGWPPSGGYGMPHWGPKREDVRPKVKHYGNYEAPEDEVIDPKIIEAEARKREEERAARGGRPAVSMRWTPDGGFERVFRPHPPEPPASAKRATEEVGFDAMGFQEPPPPPPPIDIVAAFPDSSSGWPAAPNPYSAPSPYGPPSPYGMPPAPPLPPPGRPW